MNKNNVNKNTGKWTATQTTTTAVTTATTLIKDEIISAHLKDTLLDTKSATQDFLWSFDAKLICDMSYKKFTTNWPTIIMPIGILLTW